MARIAPTLDDLAAEHRAKAEDKQAKERAEKKARSDRERLFRDFLKSFILDALHEEFHVSLHELTTTLTKLHFQSSPTVQIDEISVPLRVEVWLGICGLWVRASFNLTSRDEIRYKRSGAFWTEQPGKHLPFSTDSLGKMAVFCQDRAHEKEVYQYHQAKKESQREAQRQAQQRTKEDEQDALLDALGDDPIAIHLLKLFLAIQRERDGYGERIDALDESLDRSTETAAASLGDLQTEIEQTNVMLSQERAGRQYAEDELYTERRDRERSR